MKYRAGFLWVVALILSGCASNGWPGQSSVNPTVEEYTIVKQRWAAASTTQLGSAQDVADITAALNKAHPDIPLREIRWISPTEAMAQCARGDALGIGQETYYSALEKKSDGWHLVAWYIAYFS